MQDQTKSNEPQTRASEERGTAPAASDLKWRILAAVILLGALAALVIKQSF